MVVHTFLSFPCALTVSTNAWYNCAAIDTASSVDLQTNPWHSKFLSAVLVMQANIGGCWGSIVDLFVYFSSDFDRGQNNLYRVKNYKINFEIPTHSQSSQ